MRNINYKSDFPLFQAVYMREFNKETRRWEKRDVGFPDYDFTLTYFTSTRNNSYVAHCKYDRNGIPQCVNCKKTDDGRLLVLFNNHGLQPGPLKVEIDMEIPNEIFQDGFQKEVIPGPVDVNLWDRPTEGYGPAEAEALLPYIKGEDGKDGKDFTFDDFTPEQLADITDKAGKKAVQAAEEKVNNVISGKSKELDQAIEEAKKRLEDEMSDFGEISDDDIDEMWDEDD